MNDETDYSEIDDKIKKQIVKLFAPTLKKITRQTNCDHIWKEKNGAAYFRCKKCGYLADDLVLDRLIMTKKIIQQVGLAELIKFYKP